MSLTATDPDGDIVKCRFASSQEECGQVCPNFPDSYLDQVSRFPISLLVNCYLTSCATGELEVYLLGYDCDNPVSNDLSPPSF